MHSSAIYEEVQSKIMNPFCDLSIYLSILCYAILLYLSLNISSYLCIFLLGWGVEPSKLVKLTLYILL